MVLGYRFNPMDCVEDVNLTFQTSHISESDARLVSQSSVAQVEERMREFIPKSYIYRYFAKVVYIYI